MVAVSSGEYWYAHHALMRPEFNDALVNEGTGAAPLVDEKQRQWGIVFAVAAYSLWGTLPLYWKALSSLPAMEILAHRVLWGMVMCFGILALTRKFGELKAAFSSARSLGNLATTAALVSFNWALYIWAVNNGHVLDTSLGYFINPLLSVLLGVLFLGEGLRRGQVAAVGCAAVGVAYLSFSHGSVPWIALGLATTFAAYGLLKKSSSVGSLPGLFVESLVASVPAVVYLVFIHKAGSNTPLDLRLSVLLVGGGAATVMPLLFFAAAARRIPLSLLGLIQFFSPSVQFALGILVFKEALDFHRLVGFVFIWVGILVYLVEGALGRRKLRLA